MDFITKQSIKESIEDEEDKLTREWTEKMACAITEQTWSLVIRKVAHICCFNVDTNHCHNVANCFVEGWVHNCNNNVRDTWGHNRSYGKSSEH
jgi:hypothetical protein